MPIITSPTNPRISKLRDLHTTRGRKKSGLFLLEGPHLLEVLLDSQLLPQEVYYQAERLQRTLEGRTLLERLLHTPEMRQAQLIEVSERVIEVLGDAQTSQGVVSVLAQQAIAPTIIKTRRLTVGRPVLLILDDIADPGNMGTILRTALAADVEAVLLTPDCVDYFSPKVVRAAAGAHITLPVEVDASWKTIEERIALHCLAADGARVLLAENGSPNLYFAQNLVTPFALIIGNEAHGPSAHAHTLKTTTITIPLANNVESLNAAMATAIILYEAVRQRLRFNRGDQL